MNDREGTKQSMDSVRFIVEIRENVFCSLMHTKNERDHMSRRTGHSRMEENCGKRMNGKNGIVSDSLHLFIHCAYLYGIEAQLQRFKRIRRQKESKHHF